MARAVLPAQRHRRAGLHRPGDERGRAEGDQHRPGGDETGADGARTRLRPSLAVYGAHRSFRRDDDGAGPAELALAPKEDGSTALGYPPEAGPILAGDPDRRSVDLDGETAREGADFDLEALKRRHEAVLLQPNPERFGFRPLALARQLERGRGSHQPKQRVFDRVGVPRLDEPFLGPSDVEPRDGDLRAGLPFSVVAQDVEPPKRRARGRRRPGPTSELAAARGEDLGIDAGLFGTHQPHPGSGLEGPGPDPEEPGSVDASVDGRHHPQQRGFPRARVHRRLAVEAGGEGQREQRNHGLGPTPLPGSRKRRGACALFGPACWW